MQVNIVCPKCEKQNLFELKSHGSFGVTCPSCDTEFQALFGITRSKRSRGHKATNSRHFDLRVIFEAREDLLSFESDRYDDVELRSKDQFVVSAINDQVRVLQNLDIRKYWVINNEPVEASQGLLIGLLIVGVFVILAIAAS